MSKPKVLGGKTDQSKAPQKVCQEVNRGVKSRPPADRITAGAIVPSKFKPAINYILGGLSDDQYQSKHQQKKLLRAATVKAWVNVIHIRGKPSGNQTDRWHHILSFDKLEQGHCAPL